MFPAHEAGHGADRQRTGRDGLRAADGDRHQVVYPDRKVVTVSGDGGFLMTAGARDAVRLRTAVVNVVWENHEFGSICVEAGQEVRPPLRRRFRHPDFVKLAEAFGMPAWRCASAGEFSQRLTEALALDLPSLIVVPIDYSIDVAMSEELGTETVAT